METGSTREGDQRQQQRRDGSWQYQGRRPKTATRKRWKLAVPGKVTKDSNKEEMEAGSTREGDQRQQQRRDGSWQYQGSRPKTATKKRWKLAVPGKETKDSNKKEMEAGSTREGDQRQQQRRDGSWQYQGRRPKTATGGNKEQHQRRRERGCYNCGETNHKVQQRRYDSKIRCMKCDRLGHKSIFCVAAE